MELSVEKWDERAVVHLPSELMASLNVSVGDDLTVDIQADSVFLRRKRPAYCLAELVAQCDVNAAEPVDMVAWSKHMPVGRETW